MLARMIRFQTCHSDSRMIGILAEGCEQGCPCGVLLSFRNRGPCDRSTERGTTNDRYLTLAVPDGSMVLIRLVQWPISYTSILLRVTPMYRSVPVGTSSTTLKYRDCRGKAVNKRMNVCPTGEAGNRHCGAKGMPWTQTSGLRCPVSPHSK